MAQPDSSTKLWARFLGLPAWVLSINKGDTGIKKFSTNVGSCPGGSLFTRYIPTGNHCIFCRPYYYYETQQRCATSSTWSRTSILTQLSQSNHLPPYHVYGSSVISCCRKACRSQITTSPSFWWLGIVPFTTRVLPSQKMHARLSPSAPWSRWRTYITSF